MDVDPAGAFAFVYVTYADGYAEPAYDSSIGAFADYAVTADGTEITLTRKGGWRLAPTVNVGEADLTGAVSVTSYALELNDA